MTVHVNNKPVYLEGAQTLLQLLSHIQLKEQKGIAIAINQRIVPRSLWKEAKLNENDSITLIHATQGG